MDIMKKTFSLQYIVASIVFLVVLGLQSCDMNDNHAHIYTDTDITLKVKAAGGNRPYGGNSVGRETRIDNIALLVFVEKGGGSVFAYRAPVSSFVQNSEHAELQVKLRKSVSNEQYTLVLLANQNFPAGDLMKYMEGMDKETALSSFTFESKSTSNDYIWYNKNDKSIPMWGELESQVITENSKFEPIYLLRALAKVDVGFNYQVSSDGQESHTELLKDGKSYSIESIYLYRSVDKGRTMPDYNLVQHRNTPKIRVDKPTLPEVLYNAPIEYKDLSTTTIITQTIYLAENAGGVPEETENTTSLVLGIKHPSFNNTENEVETHTRYFRADIANQTDQATRPILRNHRYVVGIDNITGIGSETPEEADKGGREIVITVTVADWTVVDPNLVVNGEQTFYISQRKATLDSGISSSYAFDFKTNLPKEKVTIELPEGSTAKEYLTITLDYDAKKITVSAKKDNTTGQPLTHQFAIQAGRMKISMKVIQN